MIMDSCWQQVTGSYGAYNILLVRTNANGDPLWKKIMQGSGDDLVNSVIENDDAGFCGRRQYQQFRPGCRLIL
jgi:hypothetical protein